MAGTGEAMSIKEMFQSMAENAAGGVTVLRGTVIQTDPLRIQAENDKKLFLTSNNSYIPRHLTDYRTEATVEWGTEAAEGHSHAVSGRKPIVIHNALRVGDVVHALSLNHGKQYFILDRVE